MRLVGLVAGAAATALVAVGAITYAVAEGDTGAGAGGRAASASVAQAGAGDGAGSGLTPPAADSADAGFARDMAVHHQQAVEMSYIVRDRTKDTEVRRLAYDIAQTQANQRGMLLGWLDLWGLPKVSAGPPMAWMGMSAPAGEDGALMPGMATDAQMKRLGQLDGRQAEVYYLRLMTAHHRGGIHMAEGCVARCTVGVEKRLAQGMVDAQQSEITMMADMLKKRGTSDGS
ncbi:DUF305 domain-containing protein [Streptomyces naganishii]|uniref:DUF305 domain-containing protein n=1 Tax=Streptomyces naganishii JCM 4654 TaxID=1306179 RepID=A0A918XXR0_9ACTN|nr:DUF305 domain-containing protein [Streptomyces naganishii]GHD83822.1 hypothetical protein GCM10010508_00980 [Streptomyces naganishii JCM 4654]